MSEISCLKCVTKAQLIRFTMFSEKLKWSGGINYESKFTYLTVVHILRTYVYYIIVKYCNIIGFIRLYNFYYVVIFMLYK